MDLERRIRSAIRWNANMMVLRASNKLILNLVVIWHRTNLQRLSMKFVSTIFSKHVPKKSGGDFSLFQGHIAPGIYAHAFLEDRLTQEQLDNFRQEVHGKGISSYPHPD